MLRAVLVDIVWAPAGPPDSVLDRGNQQGGNEQGGDQREKQQGECPDPEPRVTTVIDAGL